jgi:elongation factor 1-alpha
LVANKYVITLLGEKDHGKSTFIGNLLIATGTVSEHRIKDAEKYAKSGRFEPAYILDSFPEERSQEMTIDTTRAEIEQDGNIYEFIDVPGHLELIKNMLSGASNGDLAILMVSAKSGEGFQPQTKRHIFLSNLLGINAMIVAVNKMDLSGYDKDIFDRICSEVKLYLDAIGFNKPLHFIPISAYGNENIVSRSDNMPWYNNKPMFDTIREFASEYGHGDTPKIKGLRLIVQDVIEDNGKSIVFGQIYSGTILVNANVRIEPTGSMEKVLELHAKGKATDSAEAGTNVVIKLEGTGFVKRGDIITDGSGSSMLKIKAKVFLIRQLDVVKPQKLVFKFNNNDLVASAIVPKGSISPETGIYGPAGNILYENTSALVDIHLTKPYLVERFEDLRELGRFGIFEGNDLIGIGVVV